MHRLTDIVVDAPALAGRVDEGGEIIVREDDIGYTSDNVAAAAPHADPDIRRAKRGRVVYPVPGHGGNAARTAQCCNYARFMLGADARVDGVPTDGA